MIDIEFLLKEIKELNSLECKTIPEKFVKQVEEDGEFAAEVIKMLGLSHKPFDCEHLLEEMADSLQVKLSTYLAICDRTGITMDNVFAKIIEKNQKWREKMKEYTINNL